MRVIAALLSWLATTAMLAVAVPTAWAQHNLVDADGYAALAQQAASDPGLQRAVAVELSAQATRLIREHGYDADPALVRDVASAYTAGPAFPPQFAQANRALHRWMFSGDDTDSFALDAAPMLSDKVFQQLLADYNVRMPSTLVIPLAVSPPESLPPGRLRPVATWGPWVSIGAAVLTGMCALLTLLAARRRGRALTGLGVSVLLVGAVGWVGIEVGSRYLGDALNQTTADIRRIAEGMVANAVRSLHQWLDLILAAGVGLVVFGVVVAMLGGLRRS
ncbi:MAG TPA: hypothetical protein VFQ37_12930 [Mycobacterium sp.]|nr:hypothetical protein [Mycobacterium sp.]